MGLERRIRSTLTEREALSALENLRIEIQVHSNSRLCVNILSLLAEDVMLRVVCKI
jgi:hypothetical protein